MKRNCPVRVDVDTKETLKSLQRELQAIENKDIPMGEIIKRMSRGEDIKFRLKQGSVERRK
jgi:spore coat polysaccharide biosynthesis protein SpsF (cytidylyltransferase family)